MSETIYTKEQLLRALQSEKETVAIWGAYQLLMYNQQYIDELLPYLLASPFIDIQESGIAKIGELADHQYAIPLIKIFKEEQGKIKQASAIALSHIPNDLSLSLTQKWFEQLIAGDSFTRMDLEAATLALLQFAPDQQSTKVLDFLRQNQNDLIKGTVLFQSLLPFCDGKENFQELMDQYFILRDIHSEIALTQSLIQTIGQIELIEWFYGKINAGVPLTNIYEQSFEILGVPTNLEDRQNWYKITQSYNPTQEHNASIPVDPYQFIQGVHQWTQHLPVQLKPNSKREKLAWVIEAYLKNHESFSKTIPKIKDLECSFLLAIPILIALEYSIEQWLEKPVDYLNKIAEFYNSSLLTTEYRESILRVFFPKEIFWSPEKTHIRYQESPLNPEGSIHEILWPLYRGELLGYNIPWPSIFPSPDCSVHLVSCLSQIYLYNFQHFIQNQDRVSIDYALQLFQLSPQKEMLDFILEHFHYLHQYHTDVLYQTIEYLPDPQFVPRLEQEYQRDEFEIAELIIFISKIFDLPVPSLISQDMSQYQENGYIARGKKNRVRLVCHSCESSFQYPASVIYVDEEALNRYNKLDITSVWAPEHFFCKKCDSEIAFILDEPQLENLAIKSRVHRVLKNQTPFSKDRLGQKIVLFPFPRYEDKPYNPDQFSQLLTDLKASGNVSEPEYNGLLLTQIRFHEVLEEWSQAIPVLEKLLEKSPSNPEILYFLGQASFKLGHYAKARTYLKAVIDLVEKGKIKMSSQNYLAMAKRYFKMLDSKEVKRKHLRIVPGKK